MVSGQLPSTSQSSVAMPAMSASSYMLHSPGIQDGATMRRGSYVSRAAFRLSRAVTISAGSDAGSRYNAMLAWNVASTAGCSGWTMAAAMSQSAASCARATGASASSSGRMVSARLAAERSE